MRNWRTELAPVAFPQAWQRLYVTHVSPALHSLPNMHECRQCRPVYADYSPVLHVPMTACTMLQVTVMSAFLGAGDHCVITDCSYGGTNRAARIMFQKMGVEFSFVDFTNLKAIEAAIKPNTKLIFSETPVNPILKLCDIAAISQLAKSKNILHCCDGTFAPPCMMRALDLGADMALQSTTKYYDGHNMTVGGAVAAATKEIDEQLHFYQNIHGNIMSPMVAFFTLQTSKTMSLRLKQQSATAQKVAEFLHEHPNVCHRQFFLCCAHGRNVLEANSGS